MRPESDVNLGEMPVLHTQLLNAVAEEFRNDRVGRPVELGDDLIETGPVLGCKSRGGMDQGGRAVWRQ